MGIVKWSSLYTFLLHERWQFCHLSSSCKWDKFPFVKWVISVTCQTSKDKGSANNNYDDASSFQITVLVHKTTFLICVGIYIWNTVTSCHNCGILVHTNQSLLRTMHYLQSKCNSDVFTHPLGINLWLLCSKPSTLTIAMQSILKVWWNSIIPDPRWQLHSADQAPIIIEGAAVTK